MLEEVVLCLFIIGIGVGVVLGVVFYVGKL